MLRHVTHNYIINFVEGLFPLASEAHCGYTSLHKYVITITLLYKPLGCFWLGVMTIYLPSLHFPINYLSKILEIGVNVVLDNNNYAVNLEPNLLLTPS